MHQYGSLQVNSLRCLDSRGTDISCLRDLFPPVPLGTCCRFARNSSHAHESSSPHLEKKLQGHVAPNITIVRQTWYAKQQKRWDEKEGGTIDSMLKDDGPKQLQNAMLVLCIVAGTVICGGACGIVCLWSNRERGWSSAAKAKKRVWQPHFALCLTVSVAFFPPVQTNVPSQTSCCRNPDDSCAYRHRAAITRKQTQARISIKVLGQSG